MSNFIIRLLSLNGLLNVITGAFDRLEELADKVHEKVEKVDNKITDVRINSQRKISKATETFNNLVIATKANAGTKVSKLESEGTRLSSEENKARTLAKNWKKVMLDNIS